MIGLILIAVLLVLLSAWLLVRPLGRAANEEPADGGTQQEYASQRDRLIAELEELERQRDEGAVDADTAGDEHRRLEAELAAVLRVLEKDSAREQWGGVSGSQVRLHRLLGWAVFGLGLPVVAAVLYGIYQADTLTTLVGRAPDSSAEVFAVGDRSAPVGTQSEPAASAPPQILAMVQRLESRLQESPDDGKGWKMLGRSYHVLGRYREAVAAYSRAAELLPGDAQVRAALQELARIAEQRGDHPKAKRSGEADADHPSLPPEMAQRVLELEQRLAEEPEDPKGWARLGWAYRVMGQMDRAYEALAEAYRQAPDDPEILAAYAEVKYLRAPRAERGAAYVLYDKLHALDPKHPDGLWFTGLQAYGNQDYARTVELWTQLLEVLPQDSEARASVQSALARVRQLSKKEK